MSKLRSRKGLKKPEFQAGKAWKDLKLTRLVEHLTKDLKIRDLEKNGNGHINLPH
jgi:hypothetical protein